MSTYYNYKRYETLLEDTENFVTECNSITYDNRGDVTVTLFTEGTALEIVPGETVSHNNYPGVTEITFYQRVEFDKNGQGIKKLFVTREFVVLERPTNIYQSPYEK